MTRIGDGCYRETYRGRELTVTRVTSRDDERAKYHWNIAIDGDICDGMQTKREAQSFGRKMIDNA